MTTYSPDAWNIIEIDSPKYGKIYKVFAGWYGGFAGANSWKLSSGIEDILIEEEIYVMPQSSGSEYRCHQSTERMTGLMLEVYANFQKSAETGGYTIKTLNITELIDMLKANPAILSYP